MTKYINRDDVLEQVILAETRETMFRRIMDLPTADVVEKKHGSWWHYEGELTCSECAVTIYDDIMSLLGDDVPRFCPNCGANMEAPTDV